MPRTIPTPAEVDTVVSTVLFRGGPEVTEKRDVSGGTPIVHLIFSLARNSGSHLLGDC